MQITSIKALLLKLPLDRPVASSVSRGARPLTSIMMPVVHVHTDVGLTGLGYAWCFSGGKAMVSLLEEDFAPALIGADPLDPERLWQELYWRFQGIGRHGLTIQAQSAIDLALWDLKGKACQQPVYKLLGGTRDRTPVYGSDGGWLNMSVDEVVCAAREYLDQGMRGIKLKVGHADPSIDVDRVRRIRELLGDDVWIAVDANQKWDFPTALRMGREFEQLGIAWYEEPMICEDVGGHARLSAALDVPIALGETLGSRFEIDAYLQADAVDIVQPDVTRVGGITEAVRIAALCEAAHRPVEPHLMMEASVHLACGLPGVDGLEYMPWLTSAFAEAPQLEDGHLVAPQSPGLGLEVAAHVIERHRIG